MGGKPHYTNEAMVAALVAYQRGHGRSPSYNQWADDKREPSASAITMRFGSWIAALHAAGLEPNKSGPRGPRKS